VIVSVKEFGVVISAGHHRHELRGVSPLIVLFHKDLPNEWPASVAQLSSMTQLLEFARLLAGDIVEPISSRTARH
jgi:predicted sugar kinase